MSRDRQCDDPVPAYGGHECPGIGHDTQVCDLRECPGTHITVIL